MSRNKDGKDMGYKELYELALEAYGSKIFVFGASAWCPPELRRRYGRVQIWADGHLKHSGESNYKVAEALQSVIRGETRKGFGLDAPISFKHASKGFVEGVLGRVRELQTITDGMDNMSGDERTGRMNRRLGEVEELLMSYYEDLEGN